MRIGQLCVGLIIAANLASCGETRFETPKFFQEKTGIPLCPEARVKNRTVGDYDYETDFTYSVDLYLSERCDRMFMKELSERLKVDCTPFRECDFMDANSWSYEIRRLNSGHTVFTLRAT